MMKRLLLLTVLLVCLTPGLWAEPWAIATSAAPLAGTVSCVTVTTGQSNTDAMTYDTASITPTAGALVLVYVGNIESGVTPDTPTVAGNSLTYAQVATVFQVDGADYIRTTVFRAMGTATTGLATITFANTTQLTASWSVAECTGIDTGGTNGSAAIVQSAVAGSGQQDCLNEATCTVTLSAFGSADNGAYGAFTNGTSDTITVGSGFTSLGSAVTASTPNRSWLVEWRADEDTTVDAGGGAASADWSAVALEIKQAVVASGGGRVLGGGIF